MSTPQQKNSATHASLTSISREHTTGSPLHTRAAQASSSSPSGTEGSASPSSSAPRFSQSGTVTTAPSRDFTWVVPSLEEPPDVDKGVEALVDAIKNSIERGVEFPPEHFYEVIRPLPLLSVCEPPLLSESYQRELLRPPKQGEPRCLMGDLCLGVLLARHFSPAPGYALRAFRTPQGDPLASMCLLCLNMEVTLRGMRGTPQVLFAGVRPFQVSALSFTQEGGWGFA